MSGSSIKKPLGDSGAGNTLGQLGGGFHHIIQGYGDIGQGNFGGAMSEYGQGFTEFGKATGLVRSPDQPDTQLAPPQPSAASATQGALQNQLQQEVTLRASRVSLPMSGGLLDAEPQTASRVLLGS